MSKKFAVSFNVVFAALIEAEEEKNRAFDDLKLRFSLVKPAEADEKKAAKIYAESIDENKAHKAAKEVLVNAALPFARQHDLDVYKCLETQPEWNEACETELDSSNAIQLQKLDWEKAKKDLDLIKAESETAQSLYNELVKKYSELAAPFKANK